MTVYARSDVCYVAISKDHGGCGVGHGRPVVHGAPAKVWSLTCHDGCEDLLRHDPLWAPTPQAIPETPDEVVIREDVEKRGEIERASSMAETNQLIALALSRLAEQGELSTTAMSRLLSLIASDAPSLLAKQPQIIEGAPSAPAALEDAPAPDAPAEPSEPASAPADALPDLESLNLADLKEIAQARGLPTTRAKADQITIIREALEV
jgi:hypothetical protein